MQGNINFTGSLDGLISGGGDGSVVTITPTYDSGTKVADYTIDSVPGSIYVPAADAAVTDVKVNMENPANWVSVVNGAGVAEVDLHQYTENVLAPFFRSNTQDFITMADVDTVLEDYQKRLSTSGTGLSIYGYDHNQITLTFDIDDYLTLADAASNYQRVLTAGMGISIEASGDDLFIYTSFDINDYLTTTDAASTYQEKLVAGTNITIDPDTNVISATGGGGGSAVDYSTTEQATGEKWIDGSDVYRKVFNLSSMLLIPTNADVQVTQYADFTDIKQPIKCFGVGDNNGEEQTLPLLFFKYNNNFYVGKVPTSVGISYLIIDYTKNI